MKQQLLISICTIIMAATGCGRGETKVRRLDAELELEYCHRQIVRTLDRIEDTTLMPRNILPGQSDWNLVPVSVQEWTVGFWPGTLWYGREASDNELLLSSARHYTSLLDPLTRERAYDHDLGFQMFCSYGNAYRLTGDQKYRDVVLRAADTLATLFNPVVGTILSWPRERELRGWPHNTIIDNMINLEMLYWAARNGGDPRLAGIATRHAETTMKHGFRPDGGNYHVAVYDPLTGEFIKGVTHQGYADTSLWARGQSWAIYGFTMVYRETGDERFLRFAEKVSDLYLSRLPDDMVPYWDFDAPGIPDEPRDASAAAVTASGLLELSTLEDDPRRAARYFDAAERMLVSLSSAPYRGGTDAPSLLLHSTGHRPNGSEVDAAIIYADYYYIEALLRYKKITAWRRP